MGASVSRPSRPAVFRGPLGSSAHGQEPFVQVPPSPQTVPHDPQLFESVCRFTQVTTLDPASPPASVPASVPASPLVPPHDESPVPHVQTPAAQEPPGPHLLLQAPQLAGLFCTLTHTDGLPHSRSPVGHWQVPPLQTRPPVQATPHAPQFISSV
jgi:hypothetical protein